MNRILIRTILLYGLIISFLVSCKKDDEDNTSSSTSGETVSGKVEKGPFKKGADVVITEVNSQLEPTAKTFTTTVKDDAGSFSFDNISISKGYASITATGYYYMENYNLDAPYRIYLEAVADVQGTTTINVNLLTHLIKPRIEKLVAEGSTFSSARDQAQNELKAFLHNSSADHTNFEDMTLADNDFLFAVSLLFQKKNMVYNTSYNYVNDLSHLLSTFRSDFKDNGQIDSHEIIDTLLYNANRIELIDTRISFENYMASLGFSASLSGFEQYIYAFQKAYSPMLYNNYSFPDPAIFDREVASAISCKNLLNDSVVNVPGNGDTYNLSAIVPIDSSLLIKFTRLSPDTNSASYSMNNYIYGWKLTIITNTCFTLEAQRKNYPNGMMLWLWSTTPDSARIEYFRNNETIPSFSKILYW